MTSDHRALTWPQEHKATRDYAQQVARDLDLDRDLSDRVADYIANEIERVGGSDARLVITVDDGAGPYCSWCWGLGGMCPHIAGGSSEHYPNAGS
ncbi:hypothetical protein FFT09_22550 [Saccharomonospora piscinae]|uniref:hypothetical protein n=1 Tax=Saccharomonospora piscinae TaxID=687388 RepID=UPI001107364E|nr:hypothetical protein [Saccharomonospora piscinae]TLW89216.1 hypothetical protein FFT09_22550 [Saccharomonospora piscinae]